MEECFSANVFMLFGEFIFLAEDRWVSMYNSANMCGGCVSPICGHDGAILVPYAVTVALCCILF